MKMHTLPCMKFQLEKKRGNEYEGEERGAYGSIQKEQRQGRNVVIDLKSPN